CDGHQTGLLYLAAGWRDTTVSPGSLIVSRVSRPTSTNPSHLVVRHPARSPRVDARARWTPGGVSARIQTAPNGAGWAGAISVPTGSPAADPGASGTAPPVTGTFWRHTAPCSMASG